MTGSPFSKKKREDPNKFSWGKIEETFQSAVKIAGENLNNCKDNKSV